MKKDLLLLLCIFSLLAGKAQTNTRTDSIVFSAFPEEKNLSFEQVFTLKNNYARRLYLQDSTIITWSLNEDGGYFFRRYSLTGQPMPGGYIKAGRGFGEVGAPLSGGTRNNNYWLHDISRDKLVIANPAIAAAGRDTLIFKEYKLPEFFYSVELSDSLKILGSGNYDSRYKVSKVDIQTGKTVSSYGSYSPPPAGIPFNSWKSAYEGFLFIHPGAEKAVLACRYTDQVEIFDLEKNKSRIIKGPENYEVAFSPFYSNGRDLIERTADTRFAFVSGMATKEFIYLLYSGNYEVEGAGNNNSSGKYIYVYDWEGRPVKKIILDRYLNSFTVTGDNSMIYGFDNTAGTIVRSKTGL